LNLITLTKPGGGLNRRRNRRLFGGCCCATTAGREVALILEKAGPRGKIFDYLPSPWKATKQLILLAQIRCAPKTYGKGHP